MNPFMDETSQQLIKTFSMNNGLILEGTVFGHMPSGKNNYIIVGKTLIKKPEVIAYEQSTIPQMNSIKRKAGVKDPIDEPCLALVANVVFQSFRRDLDTILFCDLLQKSGIIKNDRAIRIKLLCGIETDPKNPRVEFELYRIKEEDL